MTAADLTELHAVEARILLRRDGRKYVDETHGGVVYCNKTFRIRTTEPAA